MCLPGIIYTFGAGKLWIVCGLIIGTIAFWMSVAERFRDYNRKLKSRTISEFLSKRFACGGSLLRRISALIAILLLTLYLASALAAGATVLATMTRAEYSYRKAMLGLAIMILLYSMVRRYLLKAFGPEYYICVIVLIMLAVIPVLLIADIGVHNYVTKLVASGLNESASDYINVFVEDGDRISILSVFSQLSCGLAVIGIPHIVMNSCAPEEERDFLHTRRVIIAWTFLVLVLAGTLGLIGRAYVSPQELPGTGKVPETLFVKIAENLFGVRYGLSVVTILSIVIVLALIVSHAEILLDTISKHAIGDIAGLPEKEHDHFVFVVPAFLFLAGLCADRLKLQVSDIVAFTWAGLGASFGPSVILSLFWKRMNQVGAMLGMLGGAAGVAIWDYARFIPMHGTWFTLKGATGVYALPAAFALSMLLAVLGSLITRQESEDVQRVFDDVKNGFFEQ